MGGKSRKKQRPKKIKVGEPYILAREPYILPGGPDIFGVESDTAYLMTLVFEMWLHWFLEVS